MHGTILLASVPENDTGDTAALVDPAPPATGDTDISREFSSPTIENPENSPRAARQIAPPVSTAAEPDWHTLADPGVPATITLLNGLQIHPHTPLTRGSTLPALTHCDICFHTGLWESIYRDGIFRCEICEPPPDDVMFVGAWLADGKLIEPCECEECREVMAKVKKLSATRRSGKRNSQR
jgi:hypothetical protein